MTICTRRRMLQCSAMAGVSALAGCQKGETARHFHGLDITGAFDNAELRLNDPQGRERTIADFQGKVVLLFFGFTQCPDVCPTTLVRAVEIKQLLGAQGDRLQVLFVTLDPERDTPEILKAYTEAFDPGFVGLYGDAQRTADIARNFKVYYKKVPTGNSYTLDHSTLSYGHDPQGRLRLAWRHTQSAQECADDVQQLLQAA